MTLGWLVHFAFLTPYQLNIHVTETTSQALKWNVLYACKCLLLWRSQQ